MGRKCSAKPKLALPQANGVSLSWPSPSSTLPPQGPWSLSFCSCPLVYKHSTWPTFLSSQDPPCLLLIFPTFCPRSYICSSNNDLMTSFTSSGILSISLMLPGMTDSYKYSSRCPGPGSFPSSSDCSHFWECLGEDQVSWWDAQKPPIESLFVDSSLVLPLVLMVFGSSLRQESVLLQMRYNSFLNT